MALSLRRTAPTEPPVSVERLADEPELRPIAETLSTLQALKLRLERERERLALEASFAENASLTTHKAGGDRDRQLRARLGVLQADAPLKPEPAPHPDGQSPTVSAALALLEGKPAPPPNDRPARRAAVERELLVVEAAWREQSLLYDAKAEELSTRKCESLRAQHDRMNIAIFRKVQELSRLVDDERAFRAHLLISGYQVAAHILSPLNMPGLLMIGSETQHDSNISTVRRYLESQGLLS